MNVLVGGITSNVKLFANDIFFSIVYQSNVSANGGNGDVPKISHCAF